MKGLMMDEKIIVELNSEDLPLKHQFGRMAVGSIAAFVANNLAEKAYVAALYKIRARKGH